MHLFVFQHIVIPESQPIKLPVFDDSNHPEAGANSPADTSATGNIKYKDKIIYKIFNLKIYF